MALADLVRDGDHLYISSGAAEPAGLIDELTRSVAPHRANLNAFQVLTGSAGGIGELAAHGHRIRTTAPGPLRSLVESGKVELLDISMRQCATAIDDGSLPVDGVLLSGVQAHDRVFPVPATDLTVVASERARFRAVELQPDWPTEPHGPSLPITAFDYVTSATAGPREFLLPEANALSRRIGELVTSLIPDGATIELGVGRALAAIADCLIASGKRISVHSGLISDWTQKLVEADVACRPLACGANRPVVAAIALGTNAFNQWLRTTDSVAFAESRHSHDPGHLMTLAPFVAVNSAAAVDLHGNVGLPPDTNTISTGGGLVDFAIGGSYGGLSIIALPSTTSRGSQTIVETLGAVHLPGSLVTHVITERGIADLRGKTPDERRAALTAIRAETAPTHPPAR